MANRFSIPVDEIPWVPLRTGLSMRPLHFERDGYALQLRLEPGTVIARHRHTGLVHALNISGSREILGSGEIVGPGEFVFEPVGNIDSWQCHGDAPCVIQLSLTGRVEYLDDDDQVINYSDSTTAQSDYRAHCRAEGIDPDPRIVGYEG